MIGQIRKAIGAAIGGLLTWGTLVVDSKPAGITAHEWLALGALGATVAAVFGLTNDDPPPPDPTPPATQKLASDPPPPADVTPPAPTPPAPTPSAVT